MGPLVRHGIAPTLEFVDICPWCFGLWVIHRLRGGDVRSFSESVGAEYEGYVVGNNKGAYDAGGSSAQHACSCAVARVCGDSDSKGVCGRTTGAVPVSVRYTRSDGTSIAR